MLAEVIVALQSLTVGGGGVGGGGGGYGGMLAQKILCSEVYSGAFCEKAYHHNHHHLLSYWNWLIPIP